jgi:zinc transporter 5/7
MLYDSSKYVSSKELMATLLIPVPFVLTALVLNSRYIPEYRIDPAIAKLDDMTGGQADLLGQRSLVPYLSFFSICMLTSLTLLLVGTIGEIMGFTSAEEEKVQRPKSNIMSGSTAQRVFGRVLSIGLPFFAASQLGGERVAIVVLVTVAADIMTTTPKAESVSRAGGLKSLVTPKKWTVGALGMQAVADTLHITSPAGPVHSVLGYLALGCSVFLVPLPYPTDRPKLSFATSPTRASGEDTVFKAASWDAKSSIPSTGSASYKSPLTSTPFDTDLTLASGVLAGGTGFAVYFLSSAESQSLDKTQILGGVLTALASALSLLLAGPKDLKSNKKYGVAIGLVLSVVVQELLEPHSLIEFVFQIILIGVSWTGMRWDSYAGRVRSGSIQSTHHDHDHDHNHDHHDHAAPSRISAYLIAVFRDWSLIHSILIEKDSRRILYFMMYGSSTIHTLI